MRNSEGLPEGSRRSQTRPAVRRPPVRYNRLKSKRATSKAASPHAPQDVFSVHATGIPKSSITRENASGFPEHLQARRTIVCPVSTSKACAFPAGPRDAEDKILVVNGEATVGAGEPGIADGKVPAPSAQPARPTRHLPEERHETCCPEMVCSSTFVHPPLLRTIPFTAANPNPRPVNLVEKKGSNILPLVSSSIPRPVSLTSRIT